MDNQLTQRASDFTTEELESLQDFKSNGRPGLQHYVKNDQDTLRWFELYMSGKTYTEISKISNVKKDVILLVSETQGWCQKRTEYYNEMNDMVIQKYTQAKLESINTVTTMVSALNKYFGNKFNSFLATNDKSIIEELDTRLLAQYQKAQENMDKIMGIAASSSDSDPKNPIVNINMMGGKITQTDKNTIEIDPSEESEKEKAVGEILASLSKLKKVRDADNE